MSTAVGWFEVRQMRRGLWMICEPGHVASWLILGRDRACLVDTGLGVRPLRPVVEAITPLPVVAVNSHYHFDHVGGNAEFDTVLGHPGADLSERAEHDFVADRYYAFAAARNAQLPLYQELDEDYFGNLGPDSVPKELPDNFRDRMIDAAVRNRRTGDLADGDVVDLGGRTITAMHTPGHSPDSLCFYDDRDGVLLTGDTFNIGAVYCHFADSDLALLTSSAERLAGLDEDVSYVVAHHTPRLIGETSVLRDYADALRGIDHESPFRTEDVLGQECDMVTIGPFGITLPIPGSASLV